MRFSFITATYNGLEYTKAFIESFYKTLPSYLTHADYEYFIVDDASTDGTRDFLHSLPTPPFRILLNEKNSGFAFSNNRAAQLASGEFLVFLNNDLILTHNWLEPMHLAFEKFPDLGCVGNIQIGTRTQLIDHAGIFFELNGCSLHARKNRKSIPKGDYRFWNAVTAACMIVQRDLFLDLNGFDTAYRNGCEDVDICIRIRNNDKRIAVANRSCIFHHVSVSPGRHNFNDANLKLFLSRWHKQTSVWGQSEWPAEYLQRYARKFWRLNFTKFCKAIWLLAKRQVFGKCRS